MKKSIALLLTVMLLSLTVAFAEPAAIPSKTTTDLSQVIAVEPVDTAVDLGDGFAIVITEDTEPVIAEYAKLYDAVVKRQSAPITYFPQGAQEAAAALAPGVADVQAMELNEFVTIRAFGYKPEFGDVNAWMSFATAYSPEQSVVAIIGLYDGAQDADGNYMVEWIALPAQVELDGTTRVYFAAEHVIKLESSFSACMALLSTPV